MPLPKLPETPEEHRAHILSELQRFTELVEDVEAPQVVSIIRLRRALSRFENHLLEAKGGKTGFFCCRCGETYAEDYMVHNEVWKQAVPDVAERYQAMVARGLPKRGLYLHLRCMEKILGRTITVEDLSPAPCNDAIRYFLKTN